MSWNYNAELSDLAPDQVGADIPRGIKITKTFIDDSTGQALVTVEATKEDAKENAEVEFLMEYITLARSVFSAQVDRLLNYDNGVRELRPGSDATLHGMNLRSVVETINYLLEE